MDSITERISEKLAWEMTGWKSMHVKISHAITAVPEPMTWAANLGSSYDYVETAVGQRRLDVNAKGQDATSQRYQVFFDGKEASFVAFDEHDAAKQKRVSFGLKSFEGALKHGLSERPRPLFYFYVNQSPLYELLKTGSHVGSGRVANRDCEIFDLPNVRYTGPAGILKVHLDRDTGIPMKVVFGYTADKPMWVWEAATLDEVQGFHFPKRSIYTDVSHGGGKGNVFETTLTVEELTYNQPYKQEDFRPVAQEGAVIFGKPRTALKREREANRSVSTSSVSSTPLKKSITASPSRFDDNSYLGSMAVLFGVCLIGVAITLKFVRK